MKIKSIAMIALIWMGSLVSVYKGQGFIQQNVYLPIRLLVKSKSHPDLSQYKKTNCPENATTIATFGQSNSANSMTELSNVVIPPNVYQYDWKSQKCYIYKEPLLGASGIKGNVITIRLEAETSDSLAKMEGVVGSHMERFAFRDEVKLSWVRQ